jgi:O-glycosyl hydrolase
MELRRTPVRLARLGLAAVLAGGALAAAGPPIAGAQEAQAGEVQSITVRPDPSYQQSAFEGWGTSLVWFANATGGYSDEVRNRLADLLFGEDGLRLNIARYNIGGGNAPDVRKDYMKAGATMEGFWNAPEGTTREDMDWWDPDNPEHWDWDADANQRWWVDRIKDKVDTWEAFSNSPPWFQTVSGYVSGGFNASADQIRPDKVDEFATYLVRVSEHIEREHGIEFDLVEPLNEPNTPYWGTQLGPDGQPTGGRQEGAHAGPALQQSVVLALQRALSQSQLGARLSAMDETDSGRFRTNWNGYNADTRAAIDQLNVHTYGTGDRTSSRDIAKGADKPLWMSEVDGTWGNRHSFTDMDPGLGIAERIVADMRELEPSAWLLWQAIEDYNPQFAAGKNWGAVQVPFDCAPDATLETCPVGTNTKFNTIRNFTHFVRPGDRVVKVDDTSSMAAVSASGDAATVVHVNSTDRQRAVKLDLSRFGVVLPHATVTPVVSDVNGALVRGTPVRVGDDRSATLTVPSKSVTTFVVDGVKGVSKDAALVQEGHVYGLTGVHSGKALAPAADGGSTVIRTADQSDAGALWRVEKVTEGVGNRERYTVSHAVSGQRLADRGSGLVLEPAGEADPATQWIMSTTGDGTYTFVNAATGRLPDVTGQATADGSPVGLFTPSSGANQRWTVVDRTVLGAQDAAVFTVPGRTPELPSTVPAKLRDGTGGALPVQWEPMPVSRWSRPGTVRVPGTATDPLGRTFHTTAVVTVDTIASTQPARAKAYVGGTPSLPATVIGVGTNGGTTELPVTWQAMPTTTEPGVVTVQGTASVVDGSTVPATARVQVTRPVETNAALEDGVRASSTYTEPGYSPDRLRNGVTNDKAWSNWRSGTKNPSDTLTYQLPGARDVNRVVVHFYRDGSTASYAQSLRVQVRDAGGTWVDASDVVPVVGDGAPAPVVEVPLRASATDAVRVVFTARPSLYMTISEIEVFTKAPGQSAEASAAQLAVDGTPVAGFDPGTTEYQVDARRGEVTAVAADPYAKVAVDQADHSDPTAKVTVTSEDGTAQREYTVRFKG